MATRNDYLHCRMKPEELEMLDRVKDHLGLTTRTQAVAFLVKAEFNKMERAAARSKPREQSSESAD